MDSRSVRVGLYRGHHLSSDQWLLDPNQQARPNRRYVAWSRDRRRCAVHLLANAGGCRATVGGEQRSELHSGHHPVCRKHFPSSSDHSSRIQECECHSGTGTRN
jgi:hypothetical protein